MPRRSEALAIGRVPSNVDGALLRFGGMDLGASLAPAGLLVPAPLLRGGLLLLGLLLVALLLITSGGRPIA
jgi:hypothetical protein